MQLRSNIRNFSAREAFTLTELLVVMLLIGILSAVMFAEMRGTFQDAMLRAAAREVMNTLGVASSRAIALNEMQLVTFYRASNTFSIAPGTAAQPEREESAIVEIRPIDDRIAVELRDPMLAADNEEAEALEEKAADNLIHFFPDGTADRKEIILRDNHNVELTVQINPVTGRVRLVEE